MPVHLVADVLLFVIVFSLFLVLLPSEAAGGDVAVRGGGADVELGGAVVPQGVADAAVAGVGVQGGRDAGGGGDRDVAGCVRSTTVPRTASAIRMLPLAVLISAGPPSRPTSTSPSVAVRRTLVASSILIWRYAPSKATSPKRPTPRELGAGGLGLDAGAGGQLDGDLQGSGGAEELILGPGGVDPQDAAGVGDGGLLGGLDVAALGGVGGRTSTVVSARSAAMTWKRPAGMSRTAVIGAGVSNFSIVLSLRCVLARGLFRTLETLRCFLDWCNTIIAFELISTRVNL